MSDNVAGAPAHLFPPSEVVRQWLAWGAYGLFNENSKNYRMSFGMPLAFYEKKSPEGEPIRKMLDAGENPPQGAIIYYVLGDVPAGAVSLTILDGNGAVIRTFTSKPEDTDNAQKDETLPDAGKERYITTQAGLNRFVWDMRYPGATRVPKDATTQDINTGPLAAPGMYQAQLKVGEQTYIQPFEIRADPRTTASQADLEAQFALWRCIRDKLSETHAAINRLRRLKEQVAAWEGRLAGSNDKVSEAAKTLQEKLTAIETVLIRSEAKHAFDSIRMPTALNFQLASLMSVVAAADEAPTQQAYDVFDHLSSEIDTQLSALQAVIETDVPAFNKLVREVDVPAVAV
jgi:hypothetical protein